MISSSRSRVVPEESLENIPIDYKKVAITEPDKDGIIVNDAPLEGRSDDQTFIRKVEFNLLKLAQPYINPWYDTRKRSSIAESKKKNKKEKGFVTNKIRTARYNMITFFPIALLVQYTKLGNVFWTIQTLINASDKSVQT